MSNKIQLLSLTRDELIQLLAGWDYSPYYGALLWENLYRHRVKALASMEGLLPDLVARLAQQTIFQRPTPAVVQVSSDGVSRKFLMRLDDEQQIETVLMHYPGRTTVCVSTQVGCAMGCVFCATGQMGFYRHLTAGEIVGQILFVMEFLEKNSDSLRNIVFMGMGEPLHNYEATVAALRILTDDYGLGFGPRFITVSTVGLPRAIRRLADENQPGNLAVSLHAATDEERSILVPVSRRWPLNELIDACRYYSSKRRKRVFFEWALIEKQNDQPGHARALGNLLDGINAHVNLIPLNPTSLYDGTPSEASTVRAFQKTLLEFGIPSTVRQRKGLDINAGCGQLRASFAKTVR